MNLRKRNDLTNLGLNPEEKRRLESILDAASTERLPEESSRRIRTRLMMATWPDDIILPSLWTGLRLAGLAIRIQPASVLAGSGLGLFASVLSLIIIAALHLRPPAPVDLFSLLSPLMAYAITAWPTSNWGKSALNTMIRSAPVSLATPRLWLMVMMSGLDALGVLAFLALFGRFSTGLALTWLFPFLSSLGIALAIEGLTSKRWAQSLMAVLVATNAAWSLWAWANHRVTGLILLMHSPHLLVPATGALCLFGLGWAIRRPNLPWGSR